MCCCKANYPNHRLGQQHHCSILNINKMKKINFLIMVFGFCCALYSCSPESIENDSNPPITTDETGPILPPPPPNGG